MYTYATCNEYGMCLNIGQEWRSTAQSYKEFISMPHKLCTVHCPFFKKKKILSLQEAIYFFIH